MRRFLLNGIMVFGVLMLGNSLMAQDVHFSQYNSSPLLLNPSLAGLDNGDYRVYANYRMQWPTISDGNTYRTFAAGADMAIGKITKYNSYAGIGISFFTDQAGAINLSTDRLSLSLAYHFMLNKRGTMQLSAGLQGSFNYRSIDPSLATYDEQFDPSTGTVDPNGPRESFGRTKIIYGDAGLGLLYSAMIKDRTNIYFGFALDHVNQPNISFYPSEQEISGEGGTKLYMKETFHGGLAIPVGHRIVIMPNYLVLFQGPSHEFDLGTNIKTILGNDARTSNTAIHFGVQFRGPIDAVIVNSRIDYKGFSCGLSYDFNVSKLLPASHTVGAPEIALIYQGVTRKKPMPGHCPVMF